ncbi:MAG: hypothetical protein MZW92_06405 [Comamonadaceae bacterium]|nr:hypothetical protein [Comamonadaceae bacterium]
MKAKIIFAQGRQNTNYAIYLYACHPFFIQGFGHHDERREHGLRAHPRVPHVAGAFPGYIGYQSDSEVFTHILHYTPRQLGMRLTVPTSTSSRRSRTRSWTGTRTARALRLLKHTCRPLIIDGPNCVIGFTPDETMLHGPGQQEAPPRRRGRHEREVTPSHVGDVRPRCRRPRTATRARTFQPMKYDMVIVSRPSAQEVKVWNQLARLRPHPPAQHKGPPLA